MDCRVKNRTLVRVRLYNDTMLKFEHSEHLGAGTWCFYSHSTTRSAHLLSLLPLNIKNKTKHRLLIDKLCFNTYHIRHGVRTWTELWVGPVTCSDKNYKIKINAPKAPKAPQLVFRPCGEFRVAERSIPSSQHKLPRPRTLTLTYGKCKRI